MKGSKNVKLFLCMVCLLLGIGCEVKEAEVVALSVDHDSLRPMYHLHGFDCREILLELIHSDGGIEKVPLETSMIDSSDQAKHVEAGAHVLNIEAFGLDTVLTVNLYQTDYNYELINLYIQGIHQSVIKDLSYE